MADWWESSDKVHRLAQWLNNLNAFDAPRDVIYYFEKPWKWTPEYDHMVKHADATDALARDCEACTPSPPLGDE